MNLQVTPVTLSRCTTVIIHPNVCYGVPITRQEVRHCEKRKSLQPAYYDCLQPNMISVAEILNVQLPGMRKSVIRWKKNVSLIKQREVMYTYQPNWPFFSLLIMLCSSYIVCKDKKRTLWEMLTGKRRHWRPWRVISVIPLYPEKCLSSIVLIIHHWK